MAQDVRIVAPDQQRQVTVTNVSQSVALDVNVVSAMFSATVNLDPVVTVTSTQGSPVWVTGNINGNFSSSVTFPNAVSSSFSLSSSQNYDLVISQGLQGAAVHWNIGVGTGTISLSADGVNFYHESLYDVSASKFVFGATHNGMFIVPTIAGAKTLRATYTGVGSATGALYVTYAPFTGHASGSDQQTYVSGAAVITGTVTVAGDVSVSGGNITSRGDLHATAGAPHLVATEVNNIIVNDLFPAPAYNTGTWTVSTNGTSSWNTVGDMLKGRQTNKYDIIRSTASFTTTGGPYGNYDYFFLQTAVLMSGTTNAANTITVGFVSGAATLHNFGAYFYYQPSTNVLSMRLRSGSVTVQNTDIPLTASVFNGETHEYTIIKSGSVFSWWMDNVEMSSTIYSAIDSVPLYVWYDIAAVGGAAITASYSYAVQAYTSNSVVYENVADDRFYGGYLATLPATAHSSPTGTVLMEHQAAPLSVDLYGNLRVAQTNIPTTNSFSTASVSNVPVTLVTLNPSRVGLTVTNRSLSYPVYVFLGTSASFNQFTVRVPPNGYYESPYGYIGPVSAATSGSQTVTVMIGEVAP